MLKKKRIEELERRVKELEDKLNFLWDYDLKRTVAYFELGCFGESAVIVEYRYSGEIRKAKYRTRLGDVKIIEDDGERAIIKVENPNVKYLLLEKRRENLTDMGDYYKEKEIEKNES